MKPVQLLKFGELHFKRKFLLDIYLCRPDERVFTILMIQITRGKTIVKDLKALSSSKYCGFYILKKHIFKLFLAVNFEILRRFAWSVYPRKV